MEGTNHHGRPLLQFRRSRMDPDIRRQQRFQNCFRAFRRLSFAVELAGQRHLPDLEKQKVIQSFEFVHESGWNILKDYLEFQGHIGLMGFRDTPREAFRRGHLRRVRDGSGYLQAVFPGSLFHRIGHQPPRRYHLTPLDEPYT